MLFSKRKLSEKSKARLFLALPFILLDIFIRIISFDVYYIMPTMIIPSLVFSALWICSIVSLTNFIGKKVGIIFYGLCFSLFFIITFLQAAFYQHTRTFFSFTMVKGSVSLSDALFNVNPIIIALGIFLLGFFIYILMNFSTYYYKAERKKFLSFVLIFVLAQFITPYLFGFANKTASWDTWRNPRNIYQTFNDYNKCIKISGIYQYTFRDLYKTVFPDKEIRNQDEIAFLDEIHNNPISNKENEYTGIFKGKNIIFLQLEGIDSWLFNPQDMPNTYSLLDHSINFVNHYSYNVPGGATFNSEFAVTTGYLSPVSYEKSAYEFFTNDFPYSLPRVLKERGYSANAFHMNSGEYYCRELNYENFGYDNYYSLMDDEKQFGTNAELDRNLILNKSFYNKMFCSDKPFMNYIITYTAHKPFSDSAATAEFLIEESGYPKKDTYSEEEIARLFASETDYMVKLLMDALKENNLYENTVIIAYTDHYLYTIEDQTIIDKYKNTDNNLINHTPFFIWSYDLNPLEITKVNSQLDILPTVLNMFGISYNENNYIGNDIFDKNFSGYVFFDDYSWYDGNVYVEDGKVTLGKDYDEDYIRLMNDKVHNRIKQNDLTLKTDYFTSER